MTNGECSKCGSHTIYAVHSWGQRDLAIDVWHMDVITYFVCVKCGYVESYILDKESLARIEKKGHYVAPKINK